MQARVKCTLCQMSDTEISSKIPAVQDAVVKGGELTKYLFDSTEPETNSCLEHCGKKRNSRQPKELLGLLQPIIGIYINYVLS